VLISEQRCQDYPDLSFFNTAITVPTISTYEADGLPSAHVCVSGNLAVVMVDPSCYTLPYDYSLCEGLQHHGCKVTLARSHFLHSDRQESASFEDWEHFYPQTHGYARRHGHRGRFWKFAKALEHVSGMETFVAKMRRRKPDVIHFQWLPVPVVDSFLIRPLTRIAPLVLTLHNTKNLFHGSVAKLQAATVRSTFDAFQAVIVHTEYSKQRVIEQGWMEEDRIHVIPHGILDHYRAFKTTGNEPAEEREQTILFFGGIEAYKGVGALIEAFAALPQTIRATTRLVIAGKPGIDMKPILDRASLLGINQRIKWDLRYFPEEEVPALFNRASVVALPYTDIDQSGVLMTALAFDKPIVATRVGGIAETMQDGVHGRLVPPGDIASLTSALAAVLADRNLRMSMERAMRQLRSKDLSWASISRKTLDLYERLVQRERPAHMPGAAA
jgi:glycosyltransferase involved in cell wall biosynthesis